MMGGSMMTRLTFLAADLLQTQQVVDIFSRIGISDNMMHVVGNQHDALEKAHIHEATELETTKLEADLDWGLVIGGGAGLVLGFTLYQTTIYGIQFGLSTLVLLILAGVIIGGVAGKSFGEYSMSEQVEHYQQAINAGQLLVMVDMPVERVPECFKVIKHCCPKAHVDSRHVFHDHPLAA